MKKIQLILIIVIVIVASLILLGEKGSRSPASLTAYHQSNWNQYSPEIERAVGSVGANNYGISSVGSIGVNLNSGKLEPNQHIYGMVVSHHIPQTIPLLVKYYSRLKSNQTVKNIIVVGPDHNDAGRSSITVSDARFFTTYGEVQPIDGLAQKLQDADLVNIEELPFDLEHSIGSQILVISRVFPGAKVTPIIIRSDASMAKVVELGKVLAKYLDEETVLVASVDFSHYLSTDQATPLDRVSGEVLRKLDLDSLPLIKVDSNRSVAVFMKAMLEKKTTGTADFKVLNTNDLMQNSDYTTGYVFGFYTMRRGPTSSEQN